MTQWVKFFNSFFEKHKSQIETLCYTYGCREGWIQGQMYLYSKDDEFITNYYKLPNRLGKTDLYGERPFPRSRRRKMISEIKVVAPDYMTKDIDGRGNINTYSTGKKIVITNRHLNRVNHKTGSILKDLCRLNAVTDSDIDKYMILVIPLLDGVDEGSKLGIALNNITLSPKEWNKCYQGFKVRIWKV